MSLFHRSGASDDLISLRDYLDQYITSHERAASAAYQEIRTAQQASEARVMASINDHVTNHRREHQRADEEFSKLREQVEDIHDWMNDIRGRMWGIGAMIGIGGPILSALILKFMGMN